MSRRSRLSTAPRLELLEGRCLLSGVTPAQLQTAYGLNAITFMNGRIKGTGLGQTIAIVDAYHAPNIVSDLTAFDAKYGIINPVVTATPGATGSRGQIVPSFSVVNLGGATTNAVWNLEAALDVEMAHAVAPGANIVLVEARSGSLADLLAAINVAKAIPSVSTITMSFNSGEFSNEQRFDNYFTTPAGHVGITYLASAGDNGAGAEWPAASPNVIGVGGTSLNISSTSSRAHESAWIHTGGATSQYVPKPSYQGSVVPGTFRSAPDVSLDADTATGVVVVSEGREILVGGTSLSSPIWAALIAIADQGRFISGQGSLDGATQTLPALYNAPPSSFYDVTTGVRTARGYDTSTGLGTPNARTLVGYLATTKAAPVFSSANVNSSGSSSNLGLGGAIPAISLSPSVRIGPSSATRHLKPTTSPSTGLDPIANIPVFTTEAPNPLPTSTNPKPKAQRLAHLAIDEALEDWARPHS